MRLIKPVTAILPIKLGSERVPDKNFRTLGGVRLYQHALDALLKCEHVGNVVISTNDPRVVAEQVLTEKVIIIQRRNDLAQRDSSMNDVIADVLDQVGGEYFVQVHATSPFLSPKSLSEGIEKFFEGDTLSSCFSATRIQGRFWSIAGLPINHSPENLLPTQDLEPLLLDNSAFYIFSREGFDASGNRLHGRLRPVSIPEWEAWDIDLPWQWTVAECMAVNRDRF